MPSQDQGHGPSLLLLYIIGQDKSLTRSHLLLVVDENIDPDHLSDLAITQVMRRIGGPIGTPAIEVGDVIVEDHVIMIHLFLGERKARV